MRSSHTACRKIAALATLLSLVAVLSLTAANPQATNSSRPPLSLNAARQLPSDLEIGGALAGLPPGTTRYVALDSLLALRLTTFTVSDDSNFAGPTKVSGIPLEDLPRLLGADPLADLVVVICDDKYQATYPRAYIQEHHPLLVLRVNGEPPAKWPKDPESHSDMGPYMISHPEFTASSTHFDQAQIPWGVVRIDFRSEKAVFDAIAPPQLRSDDAAVQTGYQIARQYCFHCHNAGSEGGQKAGRSWQTLATFASAAPDYFSAYVRDPKQKNAAAQMPANPGYDDATIRALRDYFATFARSGKP